MAVRVALCYDITVRFLRHRNNALSFWNKGNMSRALSGKYTWRHRCNILKVSGPWTFLHARLGIVDRRVVIPISVPEVYQENICNLETGGHRKVFDFIIALLLGVWYDMLTGRNGDHISLYWGAYSFCHKSLALLSVVRFMSFVFGVSTTASE